MQQIKNIFHKDLFRPINGVVKVGDESAATVWQELDEYVVTRELSQHFHKLFSTYLEAVDNPKSPDVGNRIGVWVSGFFGSGKSHFIKIISYLLKNETVAHPSSGEIRKAVDFFEDKIDDKFFYADVKRCVDHPADVLLFNIDSKSSDSTSRDAILKVFMQVLNELQDYCAQYPSLAEIERRLERDGKYEAFKGAFQRIQGNRWQDERDAYMLRRDEIVAALGEATGISAEAAAKLVDEEQSNYSLSVETFAQKVKEYLDGKGKNHRIFFVADEVGQFIGTNTHLMLNLQTIVENLGTVCNGRAWVVVTSQEDIDAVLGNVVGAKSNDFSKIQGRFTTRISLSSSNTDEVIQARLLEKTPDAKQDLDRLFQTKGDVLRNQLSFSNNGATLKNFKDENDFSINYPFAPYHYQLVQAVFESIRKAGATGLHLARGERSMLDAFQHGAQSIAEHEIGKLVPFYTFYSSVESFLDTAVALTINQASENEGLQPFDVDVLRLLFLIRYVDIVKPNIENLVTLCITQVDDDRIALKRQLEESLGRLETQTLINHNGDLYYFLTNEERDIGREIKGVDVSADQHSGELAKFIFNEVLVDSAKYRYPENKKDFAFNRLTDSRPFQGTISNELNLEVVTPLNYDFDSYTPQKCILQSADKVLVKLGDGDGLQKEVLNYLRTQRYIQQKNDAAAPETTRRILRQKAEENQQQHQRIVQKLKEQIETADIYAAGQQLSAEKKVSIGEAQNYLIKNLYSKLSYLNAPAADPIAEMKAVLLADDLGQQTLALDSGQPNANAIKEVQSRVTLLANSSVRTTLEEITQFYAKQPYGWREHDTALLVAKLFAAGELSVKMDGGNVEPRFAVEAFTKPGKWKQVSIWKRQTTGAAELAKAAKLAHEVFGKMGDAGKEDALAKFIRDEIAGWQNKLAGYKATADTGGYPGAQVISGLLNLANDQNGIPDTYLFFHQFIEKPDEWHGAAEDFVRLRDFYENQITVWRQARSRMNGSFKDNRSQLDLDAASGAALLRLEKILADPEPYSLIHEINGLIARIDAVNQQVLAARRRQAADSIETKITQLKTELDSINADADTRNAVLTPFQQTKTAVDAEESIQRIAFQAGEHLDNLFENALDTIDRKRNEAIGTGEASTAKPVRTVNPAQLSTKTYLETEQDVEDYINALRARLDDLIKDNARIRIQ